MIKKIFLILTISLISLPYDKADISAQSFIGKINPFPETNSVKYQQDSLKILAVMVDFQTDQDAATFGNGKFGSIYSKEYGSGILDPLPHDNNYFALHFEFAKNYFRKVSGGKLNISYNILPEIITVNSRMRNYSPAPNSDDLSLLGIFAKEVWTKVDSAFDLNFADYDLFTIFHAGVGRDISLPGSFGNERDLPSVYLSDKALKNIFNNDLTDLPLNKNGRYNSMIIPETESRELDVIGGTALVEISINGLITANIASHLGLPDLFDTETGLSAIGRFGLMDGQSIFAYMGTFPPEPSPWEKLYLGWGNAIESNLEINSVSLVTEETALATDTVFLKIPLNSTEYYLVENRQRDSKGDGAIIKYVVGNDTLTKVFTKDTSGFYSFNIDSLSGVVIDVDEFDWAVPGNGILIWHIDEKIINEKLADNKINTNKFNRGVDVEEADGIQDIGEQFTTIFGDEVVGEGTEQDLWYKGNSAKLYKNRFDNNTYPSTKTNDGANTFIRFSDFSVQGTRMSFNISYRDSILKPVIRKQLDLLSDANKLSVINAAGKPVFYILSDSTLYRYDENGNLTNTIQKFSVFKPAVIYHNNTEYIAGAFNNRLNVYMIGNSGQYKSSLELSENITSPVVIKSDADGSNPQILAGLNNGNVNSYSLGNLPGSDPQLINSLNTGSTLAVRKISSSTDYFTCLKYGTGDNAVSEISDNTGNIQFTSENLIKDFALTKNSEGNYISVLLDNENKFHIVRNGTSYSFTINTENEINSFSLGDIKHNGENYLLFINGNKLEAVSLAGYQSENFPFSDTSRISLNGTPLIADFNGDNKTEIIISSPQGRIFAISGDTGKEISGFPISAGKILTSVPVFYINSGITYFAALTDNHLFSWQISETGNNFYWSGENAGSLNSSFVDAAQSRNVIQEYFPENRAYNWPNPVYDNITNIRYYVSEDSKINIKIFDLAGDFVAELNSDARGGFDNETIWDVSDIQSGVYLARIEASGISGNSGNRVIKIAVIK